MERLDPAGGGGVGGAYLCAQAPPSFLCSFDAGVKIMSVLSPRQSPKSGLIVSSERASERALGLCLLPHA